MTKTELTAAVQTRLAETKTALSRLDDETALEVTVLFPEWKPNTAYAVDERIRYADKLYRVVQAHTSQSDWTPDKTPALFAEVAKPGEIPVWRQPTGAQDAYGKGDRVRYPDENGAVFESTVDGNVWSPEAYPDGWKKIE